MTIGEGDGIRRGRIDEERCSGWRRRRRRLWLSLSRQQLLSVHVRLLDRVAYPVVRVADDEQPVLAVDQYAAAAAQYGLPAAFDVLAREHDLVVRLHEHRDQHQRAAQHQTVREQRHGRVHERGGHVYPTVYVVRQVAHALRKRTSKYSNVVAAAVIAHAAEVQRAVLVGTDGFGMGHRGQRFEPGDCSTGVLAAREHRVPGKETTVNNYPARSALSAKCKHTRGVIFFKNSFLLPPPSP